MNKEKLKRVLRFGGDTSKAIALVGLVRQGLELFAKKDKSDPTYPASEFDAESKIDESDDESEIVKEEN